MIPVYLALICDCGPLHLWFWRSLTVVSLGLIVYLHRQRLPAWDDWVARAMVPLAWLPPLLASAAFFLLSWRAMAIRGHWPEPMTDDPHGLGRNDWLYQFIYHATDGVLNAAGVSVILWLALILHTALRGCLTGRRIVQLSLLWLLSWMLFGMEPTHRMEWWLD